MTATLKAVESRLKAVEDEITLSRLVNSYFALADRSDWEHWSALFADDGIFVTPMSGEELTGPQAILEGVANGIGRAFAATQHYITNLEISIAGDAATASGELIFAALTENARPNQYLMMGGRYRWSFVRDNERWIINHAGNVLLWNNIPDESAV
jgi:ketosteroid isomerase-like protein